jgi:GDP-4-dehydro-6-deoxy-D-mannose reductase
VKALVTGGAGFVGTALVNHLRACGDTVEVTDRSVGGPDITDREGIFRTIESIAGGVLFHLAGQSHVPTSWEDPITTLRANVEGTQNVLDAAFAAGVDRVLVVTSAEIYGAVAERDLPITEEHPLRPLSPYAASKVGADAVALQSFLGRDQDVTRVRAFNHVGPGQGTGFAVAGLAARIVLAVRSGESSIRVGNLDPRRDFTDVRDVVSAYRHIAHSGTPGAAYNVCSGIDRSIREVADALLTAAGIQLELEPDPALQRGVDVPIVRGDNRKVNLDTGWSPKIPFVTSIADVYADAEERSHG